MSFISISFLVFFAGFFLLYWLAFKRTARLQNILILVSSYIFYGWADWRFLTYLIAASILNFGVAIKLEEALDQKKRNWWVALGVVQGIGGLVFFKYANFFIGSVKDVLDWFGVVVEPHYLNILAPLGISFFTFRMVSYVLDVDKGKVGASRDWITFFSFVAFFPSILSGPIDKARDFIPQLQRRREFAYPLAVDGLRQILWGMFKKVVIADNCAPIVARIWEDYQNMPASSLLLGAFLYTIQIYADFSGYSDIAIGVSRLLGLNVAKNFDFPFFTQNIAEFWRKWHMSLTSWMTEYVFTPLSIAFRNYGKRGLILAIVINFIAVGIWHGANWTFVVFGLIHGCYYVPIILKGTLNSRAIIPKTFPTGRELMRIMWTFFLVTFSFIFFRSETVRFAFDFVARIFSLSIFSFPKVPTVELGTLTVITLVLVLFMLAIEWLARGHDHAIARIGSTWPTWARWLFYIAILFMIVFFGGKEQQFIYFRF